MKRIEDKNYYGFVNKLSEHDNRIPMFLEQHKERGFDDTELWNLDQTIISFMLPRLKRFKDMAVGYPSDLTSDKWNDTLQKMINAFELIKKDNLVYSDEDNIIIELGLDLFTKHFLDLWY